MRTVKTIFLALVLLVVVFFAINRWIVYSASSAMMSDASGLPKADAILVPGARIYAGEVSGILAQRLDAAIEAFSAGASKKILVSGDYSSPYYDEAQAMKKYLERHGIASGAIVLDHAGFSTYDTLYRAKHVFEVQSIIIVTQDFHLPRALFIARRLGLEAVGFSASKTPLSPEQSFRSDWREPLARFKAVYDVLRRATPAFTGSGLPIDIHGEVVLH